MNILIVDDTKTDRELLGRLLADMGHSCAYATDGSEAVEAAVANKADVVFLDIVMQNMNGFDALEELADDARTSNIPVVMVSTKSLPSDVSYAKSLGAKDYIVKPAERLELERALSACAVTA